MGQASSKGGPVNDGGHSAASHRSHAAKDRDKARNRSPNNHSDGPGVNPSVIRAHTTKTTSKRRESVQYGQSRSSVAAPSESPVSATAEGSHPQGENETQRRQRSHTAGAIPIMGNEHSRQRLASPRASKPMDVPAPVPSPARIANRYNEDDFRPHAPPKGSSYGRAPVSVMPRNPHMPIPMAADHETASSPLFGPVHMDDPADMPSLEGVDRSSAVFRGSSNGSNLNREDTDLDDERIANIDPALTGRTTVDYEFEWTEPAEKVYVTGSFNNWARKYRMHRVAGTDTAEPYFTVTVTVPVGTHQVRFIVDSDMTTSKLLPTTVDTTNNLVNYIEIGPDQLSDGQNSDRATDNDAMSSVPNETSTQDPADPSYKEGGKLAASKPSLVQKRSGGPPVYTQTIPSYLTDLERPDHRSAPESQQPNPEHPEQTNYELALEAQRELPDPPTLPSFLSKVILNQPTPTGDDSSVLQVPVHSVLSHLATSAIKDGVIAVSATCRYRRKYVTTILYKPAGGITAR